MPPARFRARSALGIVLVLLVAALRPNLAFAQAVPTPAPSPPPAVTLERWSVHVQSTITQQYHGGFAAAYSGPQSLSAQPDTAKTFDATLFLGARLWKGGELYANPEIDQGFGLGFPGQSGMPYNGTFGIAGFPSGESFKLGRDSSYGRVQRLFLRQTFELGDDRQTVDPDINQLAGSVATRHLTLTAGKFAVTDVFDNNPYAHDPKNDFLNWTIIDMGAFDYAADAWGFTSGISAEAVGARSALRAGLFQLSIAPNQIAIEPRPFRQFSPILEFERVTKFFGGRPGSVKALVYGDYGYMGSYADAVAAVAGTANPANVAAVRGQRHWKLGAGLNFAQEITPHVGVFARVSAMNGTYEAFEFTDVDRSVSGGVSVAGGLFHRPYDTFAVAGVVNQLSAPAMQYFNAGGVGILVGDGALSYSGEKILETYYKIGVTRDIAITADYQYIRNPGYNLARGPVSVFGLRYHVQY